MFHLETHEHFKVMISFIKLYGSSSKLPKFVNNKVLVDVENSHTKSRGNLDAEKFAKHSHSDVNIANLFFSQEVYVVSGSSTQMQLQETCVATGYW